MRTANEESSATAGRVLLVAGFLLIAANMRVALTSVGPLIETMRADLDLTGGQAGFIGTVPLLTFAAVSPQVPRLARRIGTDRALWMALATLAVGIVARSVPVTGLLWVGTVLLGAAIAVGNVLLPSLIKRDFPDRVGAATGVYTAVMGVFASIAAGVAVPLAGALPGGWRTALGVWAGFVLVALAVWTLRLSRRRPAAVPTTQPVTSKATTTTTPWRSLLAWECAAFMALNSCGFYTVLAWYPSVLHSYGTSETTAGWLLFAYQLMGVLMSLVVPLVMTRLRDQRAIAAVAGLLSLIGYGGLLVAPGLAVVWVLISGFGAGALFFLALTFFSLRAADARSSAALAGMGQSVGYLVGALGPVLFGVLHDVTGGWRVPLSVLVGVAALHALVGLRAGRDAHVTV